MSDYTAVITGASKGIGADLAGRLLERGYTVINLSRNAPEWAHERLVSHGMSTCWMRRPWHRLLQSVSPASTKSRISSTTPD